jgi:hypothetical protein
VRIKTGATDGTKTEVIEGALTDGELVVIDATVTGGPKPSSSGLLPGGPPRGGGGPRM